MPRRGCLWALVKPVVIVGIAVTLLAVAAFPWAIRLPGRDSLDGSWMGELRTSRGPQAWLLLTLEPARGYRPRLFRGTPLGGTAVLCTARRRIELSVSGRTTSWSGSTLDVLLKPVESSPPQLRIEIAGTWNGHTVTFVRNNISLADILSESGGDASEPERSKFVSAELRKGRPSDFDSACPQLR